MKSFSDTQKKGFSVFLVLFSAFLWGVTPLFVMRLSAFGLGSGEMLFFRAGIAALSIGLLILLTNPRLFLIRLRDLWIFAGSGILSFAMFSFAYSESIQRASPAVAAALLYTAPAFVILFSSFLFKERMTGGKWVSVLFVTVGAFVVSGIFSGGALSPLGILFGLLSGFGYALYTVFGKIGAPRYHPFTFTFYTFLLSTLASLPICKLDVAFSAVSSGFGTACTVLLYSLVTCVFPYICYTAGLRFVEAGKAGILTTLEPVVASLVGVLLLHEERALYKLIGIACILGGVLLLRLLPERTASSDKPPTGDQT